MDGCLSEARLLLINVHPDILITESATTYSSSLLIVANLVACTADTHQSLVTISWITTHSDSLVTLSQLSRESHDSLVALLCLSRNFLITLPRPLVTSTHPRL